MCRQLLGKEYIQLRVQGPHFPGDRILFMLLFPLGCPFHVLLPLQPSLATDAARPLFASILPLLAASHPAVLTAPSPCVELHSGAPRL